MERDLGRSPLWSRAALLAAILSATVPAARAQTTQGTPHIGYVYPAGGKRGSGFQVEVGGRALDGVASVLVSGGGVRARVVEHGRPLTPAQMNDLREELQELQRSRNDADTLREMAAVREELGESLRRNRNPVLAEHVTIEITIDPDAEPGERFLRLGTRLGLTNPLAFCVGELPEWREIEARNADADAALDITLPATVNGRIVPGETGRTRVPPRQAAAFLPGNLDRYRFHARKGQDLVVAVSARDLNPYLADAVPGWFQAAVALVDSHGHELAYDDDYRFHPDPVLHVRIPADGPYSVEIKDALYRGREDFVYRIAIGELPFVTGIFPLGGRDGARTDVAVSGWNLEAHRVKMDARGKGTGVHPLSLRAKTLTSNRLPFAVDALPEALEQEPNDLQGRAQRINLPVIVNGRIGRPGDWDVFRFEGRAGDRIVAEIAARRLESPLDSVLVLTDAMGRRLAFDDDHEDKGSALLTHHADSLLGATLPARGTFFLRVGDIQHKGGAEYSYRLRISEPQPDYALRVTPSSINAGGSATVPLTVHALRKDGFSGDIVLGLEGAPEGFAVSGGVIPAGQDRIRLTLTVPPAVTGEPIRLRLEGRATIAGETVVRQAVPAEDMMQAFAYRHVVAADELRVSVSARGATRVPVRLLGSQPVRIPAGGSARVQVAIPPRYRTFGKIAFELSDPQQGMALGDLSLAGTRATFVLHSDATTMKPGQRGNLIVGISGERAPPGSESTSPARRLLLGLLPAIAFEITAPQ